MRSPGFTLFELLMVIAIIGILAAVSVGGWSSMSQTMEFGGYTSGMAVSLQEATSRANTTNQLYVFVFNADGFHWGPSEAGLTQALCETGTTAPVPVTVNATWAKPVGISGPSGWLCLAPTGIVSRLNTLATCTYGTGTSAVSAVPCMTFTRASRSRSILVSASGQAVVQ